MVVMLGSNKDTLANILVSSTTVGSCSLHFSMVSDRDRASAAELTFSLM